LPHITVDDAQPALCVAGGGGRNLAVCLGQRMAGRDNDGNATISGKLPGQDKGVRAKLVNGDGVFAWFACACTEESLEVGRNVADENQFVGVNGVLAQSMRRSRPRPLRYCPQGTGGESHPAHRSGSSYPRRVQRHPN
jgi:hypothetical protein